MNSTIVYVYNKITFIPNKIFTCMRNAISITRLLRYPRTRLTTPLATVDEPMSMPSWRFWIHLKYKDIKKIAYIYLKSSFFFFFFLQFLPPSSFLRGNSWFEVLDLPNKLSFLHSALLSKIPAKIASKLCVRWCNFEYINLNIDSICIQSYKPEPWKCTVWAWISSF